MDYSKVINVIFYFINSSENKIQNEKKKKLTISKIYYIFRKTASVCMTQMPDIKEDVATTNENRSF